MDESFPTFLPHTVALKSGVTSARSEPAMNILLHAERQLRGVAGAQRWAKTGK